MAVGFEQPFEEVRKARMVLDDEKVHANEPQVRLVP
jgi:hypothetical protein